MTHFVGHNQNLIPLATTELTQHQLESLKKALSAARSAASVTASQRETVREISEQTGLLRRTPEQSLVAFKSLLNDAANESGIPLGRDRATLIEQFVSVFIEDFYAISPRLADEDGDCRGKTAGRVIPAESREAPGALP